MNEGVLTPEQIRGARSMLEWSIDHLAGQAGVHRNTVLRAEKGEATLPTLASLQKAMENGGVIFIPAGELGEGVRMKAPSAPMSVLTRKRKASPEDPPA